MLTILAWYAVIMVALSGALVVIAGCQWSVALVGRLRRPLTATVRTADLRMQAPDRLSGSAEAASA